MSKKVVIVFIFVFVLTIITFFVFNFVLYKHNYNKYVSVYSKECGIDSSLVFSIIKNESGFDKNAKSSSGALGLMQLMPQTAVWVAELNGFEIDEDDLFNPEINIQLGCLYLKYLFGKFSDLKTVVCAYNAGESKVEDWLINGVIDEKKIEYPETKKYLASVIADKKIYDIMKFE